MSHRDEPLQYPFDPLTPAPLVIGVTAHRDLVPDELPGIEAAIRTAFEGLQAQCPNTPVTLLAPLADGGGRIAARVALEMGFEVIVPLPLPARLYRDDFADAASREEFDALCARATVFELPLVPGNTQEAIARRGPERDRQYAQCGIFLSSHCQVLLAIWDGKPSAALGGTAQVVAYHLTDTMPGMTQVRPTPQQLLGRDENDLVCHVVCSRECDDGAPAPGLRPGDVWFLTADETTPRTRTLPDAYGRLLARLDEFNADLRAHAGAIAAADASLVDAGVALRTHDRRVEGLFRAADWLANRYQRRVRNMFRATYTLAGGMGLAFIAYGDLPGQQAMIWVFLLLFALGVVVYAVAQRGHWHRKYLDYRALAEGLRVQLYWQLAGVSPGTETQYAHDNFLQKQDLELGWIRSVMRAGSIPTDDPQPSPLDLQQVIASWLHDSGTGQLSYYRTSAAARERRSARTHLISMGCLWTGIGVAVLLAVLADRVGDTGQSVMLVLMGVLPLIAALREAYAHKSAERELIKQYRFMEKIFSGAARQLDKATDAPSRRAILKALGNVALDEHAEWILMHRERPLEHGKL